MVDKILSRSLVAEGNRESTEKFVTFENKMRMVQLIEVDLSCKISL